MMEPHIIEDYILLVFVIEVNHVGFILELQNSIILLFKNIQRRQFLAPRKLLRYLHQSVLLLLLAGER